MFNEEKFETDLKNSLKIHKHFITLCEQKIFLKSLGDMLQLKIKQSELLMHHVTKTMRKVIMKRTELQHKYFKIRSSENLKLLKWQINFCSRLYKRERKKYFNNLHLNKI